MSNNDNTKVYIYGLKEIGTDAIRYIGHSKNVQKRFYQHKTASARMPGNPQLSAWLNKVVDNLTYDILDCVPANQARKHEEKHIRIKAGEGHDLLNIRQAARKIYTTEQAHQILNATLDDSIR